MTLTELGLVITPVLAIAGAAWAIIRDRRKPSIDGGTAKQIGLQVERITRDLNAARDLRVLDLEKWADKMRPVIWKIKDRDDVMCSIIKALAWDLERKIPNIPDFPDIPEFPEPRPLPGEK